MLPLSNLFLFQELICFRCAVKIETRKTLKNAMLLMFYLALIQPGTAVMCEPTDFFDVAIAYLHNLHAFLAMTIRLVMQGTTKGFLPTWKGLLIFLQILCKGRHFCAYQARLPEIAPFHKFRPKLDIYGRVHWWPLPKIALFLKSTSENIIVPSCIKNSSIVGSFALNK